MSKAQPVYIRIHDEIKKKIETGELKVGDKLPSERELSVEFGVSRMTLRQAIQTLADEGILDRRLGSGTYVSSQKVREKMSGTTSFTEIIEGQGKVPSSKTLTYFFVAPSISEREKLQLSEDDKVLRMERIRYADNIPICYEVATIPANLVENFSKNEVTQHFYHTLEKNGYVIGNSEQTISASLATERVSEYLSMKRGQAILKLRQLTFLENKQPFEYVRSQYVGNRFEFFLEK
ncbi:GntR family transcriptional regulator [Pilibacter termitis]|uniref:GntR family transcriptional regulator n=1 Tax=Pilibacter termitis TaxID=263852 RepID=A0A1T4LAC8_9ENTE|nr:GntR family transcriptional regulator [Pilibacter termitis]SJZ51457.1 GntR family transcriptional regulator [Pilibacter termitis]